MLEIIKRIPNFANYMAGILASFALAMVCFEVFARYFMPQILPDWGLEVTIYLTIWAMFLSVCGLPMERGHVAANFIVDNVSPKKRYFFEMLSAFFSILFVAIIFWFGIEVVQFAIFIGEEGESTLRFPKWIYYLCLPVGMFFNLIAYFARLYIDIHTPAEDLFAKEDLRH